MLLLWRVYLKVHKKKEVDIDELMLEYMKCTDDKEKTKLHEEIVEMEMELVKKIANPIAFQTGTSYEDLIQVGALGLMKAIDSYSPDRNAKFSTYASYYIKGELKHYVRDKIALIKTPRKVQERIVKVYNAIKELNSNGICEPSTKEIADYIDTTPDKVDEVLKIDKYKFTLSLDQTNTSDEDDSPLLEKIPSEDYQDSQNIYETKLLIERAINQLKPELKKVLELSFFEELNQREIAEQLNISQMQVSRKIKKALNEMYELIKGNINDKL